jgi:hypothetical protein
MYPCLSVAYTREDLETCWPCLLNGQLRRAFGEAKGLEELRLYTTLISDSYEDEEELRDRLIPL